MKSAKWWLAAALLTLSAGCGQDTIAGDGNEPGGGDPSTAQSGPGSMGQGAVGPSGGSVDHLYFAVVGDTRPALPDLTFLYPTAIIEKIFADIEGMNPRPQFVAATGDYMFADNKSPQAQEQLNLYLKASQQFRGTLFAAMGNHECNSLTNSNCTTGAPTANFTAFLKTLVAPLGKSLPYYSVPLSAMDGSWTAKLLIVACNSWDSTQETWLKGQLAKSTTYTFVVRHQPASANTGPCVNHVEALLAANPYSLSITGHVHTFKTSGKEIIVGTGGAPLDGGGMHGYATVEQTTSGFRVTQYDVATAAPISSTTIPF